ncbi:vitamin K epoxide reductase family protein [Cellulosimicrobium arenosum]|uniref:Vitamin K epoxide reductase family protein n=2 Tax=Cellulosimicrobium arenosum TaxID=2708133 RepID=A0A927PGK8_9MICO|nr:vitamin K epoxide reductase family protein [Cellulosimicrobium arenosum]MBD8080748.1 vitamin K epoxide reductase family protein [Cellulosimicrobium arenosum]
MGVLLVVLGTIGLVASAALTIERYLTLIDPGHVLSCSLNVFIDCGAAMGSWQGSLLGFPNPVLGVAAFPVVITTGVVLLVGARLPRWYWLSLLAATTVALGLVVFLVWTSLYALVALCPYCMVVWAVVWPLFWYQLVHALQEGHLPAGAGARRTLVGNRHIFVAIGYVALVAWVLLVMGPHLAASL